MPIRGVEAEWPQIRSHRTAWGVRLGLIALSTLVMAALAFRNRLITLPELFIAFGAGTVLAIIGLALSIAVLATLWRHGGQGVRLALAGALVSGLGVVPVTVTGLITLRLPEMNDATTSPDSPPSLAAVASARIAAGAPVDHPGEAVARLQAEAYPDVAPLTMPQPPETVYEAARALVLENGWRIASAAPPGRAPGLIVATASTLVLKFEDDVAIRITPARQGARIDMRSASRLGRHDFGTNARRISGFLAELEDRLNRASR